MINHKSFFARSLKILLILLIIVPSVFSKGTHSWQPIYLPSPSILQLESDRTPTGLYAVDKDGYRDDGWLYHTSDVFKGWQRLHMNRVRSITVHPITGEIFALRNEFNSKATSLWFSNDRGKNFVLLKQWTEKLYMYRVFLNPYDPDNLYAFALEKRRNGNHTVFVSSDHGKTWKKVVSAPEKYHGSKVQSYEFENLLFSPEDPNLVLLSGLVEICGGCCDCEQYSITFSLRNDKWRTFSEAYYRFYQDPYFVDRAFAAGYNGLFEIDKRGWTQLSKYASLPFSTVPNEQDKFVKVNSNGRVEVSLDRGKTWTVQPFRTRDGIKNIVPLMGTRDILIGASEAKGILYREKERQWISANDGFREANFDLIVSSNGGRVYAKTSGLNPNLYRSLDYGKTWKNLESWQKLFDRWSHSTDYEYRFLIDPLDGSRIFLSFYGELWISTDSGDTWKQGARTYLLSAIDPTNSQIMYFTNTAPAAFKSTDGGRTVQKLPIQFRQSGGEITKVVVDPFNHETVYFLSGNGLFRSEDGGKSVQNISASIQANCPSCGLYLNDMVSLRRPGAFLMLGSYQQTLLTNDAGKHWKLIKIPQTFSTGIFPVDNSGKHFFVTPGLLETTDGGITWTRDELSIGPNFFKAKGGSVTFLTDPKLHPIFLATTLGLYQEIVQQ